MTPHAAAEAFHARIQSRVEPFDPIEELAKLLAARDQQARDKALEPREDVAEVLSRSMWPQLWSEIDRNMNPGACESCRRQEIGNAMRALEAVRALKSTASGEKE